MTSPYDKYGSVIEEEIAPTSQSSPASYDKYGEVVEEAPQPLSFGQQLYKTTTEFPGQVYGKMENTARGVIRGATLGGAESVFPSLAPKEGPTATIGEIGGAFLPIGAAAKLVMAPIKALQGLFKLGRAATFISETAGAAGTGAVYGAAKEGAKATRGEETDLTNIPTEAALFGGLHTLFKAGTGAYNWLKSLRPAQQSEMLVKGILPEDLSPTEYKFFEEKVVPELQENAAKEYQAAYEKATAENDLSYKQQLANVQAKHEQDLYQMQQEGVASEEQFAKSQQDYQNQLKQLAAQHESEMAQLAQQNQIAESEFQAQQEALDQMKARQKAVDVAIQKPLGEAKSLEGRVSKEAEGVSQRPQTPARNENALEKSVSQIFTPEPLDLDTTALGHINTLAIRANDRIDRAVVNQAYNLNEELNSKVFYNHEELASDINQRIKELESIGKRSPQQEQLLQFQKALIDTVATVEEGVITGTKEVSNKVLQEQAKAMRQAMDYDFEHGNTRGIFTPTVNAIEDAVESAAILTGNEAAAEASKDARLIYSEWVRDYDNPYIKPFRDLNNFDYSRNYKALSNVDEYNAARKVLVKSNAGQQVNNLNKRGVVFEKLNKYMDNPRKVNPKEFDKALVELRAVINPEESQAIRQAFNQARKTPVIQGRKTEKPSLKEVKKKEITEVKIPLSKAAKKPPKAIEKVTIPNKPELKPTPAMKAAAQQMNIRPEEAISKSNSPSGMEQLKQNIKPETFTRVGKQKLKTILYEGGVERKFKGDELYPIVNKNFDMFSAVLGEEVASDLLVNSKEIAKNRVTVDTLKKLGMKATAIKTLLIFGVL